MSLRDQVDDYLVPNKSEGLQSQDLRTELLLVGPLASYLVRVLMLQTVLGLAQSWERCTQPHQLVNW